MDGNNTEDQNFKDSLFPMRTRGPTGEIVMRGDPFSQAEELSKEKDLRKNKGGHNGEKMYTLFTLRSATPDKFDPKQADIMCAVYDKSQGFITPFHTQLWSESWCCSEQYMMFSELRLRNICSTNICWLT